MSTPRLSELEGRLLQAPSREHSVARSWTGWLSRCAATSPQALTLGHRWPLRAAAHAQPHQGQTLAAVPVHAGCPIDPHPQHPHLMMAS
jgi:hypothetical protein